MTKFDTVQKIMYIVFSFKTTKCYIRMEADCDPDVLRNVQPPD